MTMPGVEPTAGPQRMFAHKYRDGLLYNVGTRRYVEFHRLKEPIVEVDVVEVADDDPAATHWAWMDAKRGGPEMIWPREGLFEVCFPYGSKIEAGRGRGRVVRLAVTQASAAQVRSTR